MLLPDPPSLIYHYCSAESLLKILDSGQLWHSHAAYLNDSAELSLGIQTCLDVIHSIETPDWQVLLNAIENSLHKLANWPFYVCCFSEDNDSLSQWRAYADDGKGFAIGFKTESLDPDAEIEFSVSKVVYHKDEFREAILEVINGGIEHARMVENSILDLFERPGSDGGEMERNGIAEQVGARSAVILLGLSACYKAKGFQTEQEVRSIRMLKRPIQLSNVIDQFVLDIHEGYFNKIGVLDKTPNDCLYRNGPLGLTPYLKIDFDKEAVFEIVCGPRSEPILTENVLHQLKEHWDFNFQINRSAATYR